MEAYRKQFGLKDFSPKSQDAVALQQIKERGALPMIDRGDIRLRNLTRGGNIWASLPGAGYGQFEHKADSLIANSKQRAESTGEIDVWAESPRLSPLWLSASSSARHGLLIITADNAITYKAQRDKMPDELKLANAAITDMQMRQRDVAALDAKYTKELADAKAEWCSRDDVAAGRRRLHIKAVHQSVREATIASGDNAASPDWQKIPAEWRSHFRRGWSLCKNNWKEPRSILMSSADRVAHIDGQLMHCHKATRASSGV